MVITASMMIIFVVVVFVLFSFIAIPLIRRHVINSVEDALMQQNFEAFDKRIDKWYIKLFIQPYNVDFLKLNRAMLAEDVSQINERFEHFDEVNLTDKQKAEVYMRAFNYYISQKDKIRIDKYYRQIKELDDASLTTYADRLYNIYVEKGWRYLEEMKAELDEGQVTGDQILEHESMIAEMYQNKGEKKKAQQYMDTIQNQINEMMK